MKIKIMSVVFQDEHGNYQGALEQYQVALENLLPILAGIEVLLPNSLVP